MAMYLACLFDLLGIAVTLHGWMTDCITRHQLIQCATHPRMRTPAGLFDVLLAAWAYFAALAGFRGLHKRLANVAGAHIGKVCLDGSLAPVQP